MSVQITHIRLSGGSGHEHIVRYKWKGFEDGNLGESDKPTMVDWVSKGGNAYVANAGSRASVGVIKPTYGQPYLRTHADGQWTNNLLALPHF